MMFLFRSPFHAPVPCSRHISAGNTHIVHFDIKPANILIDGKNTAKLGDVGLTKILSASEEKAGRRGRLGSPYYMAPEVANSAPGAAFGTTKSDIFSFGQTLRVMCAQIVWAPRGANGRREPIYPYYASTGKRADKQHWVDLKVHEALPPCYLDLDDNVRSLVEACVERQPENRPAAKVIMCELSRQNLQGVGALNGAAAETEYRAILQGVLCDGVVSAAELQHVAHFEQTHSISPGFRRQALAIFGWTEAQFRAGRGPRARGATAALLAPADTSDAPWGLG
jgi:serine/threonine protein kinase